MCNMEQETKTSPAVEVWKDIEGYEGACEVSTFGRVRSLDREYYKCYSDGRMQLTKHRGRILRQQLSNKGYWVVTIVYKNKFTTLSVSRLVAKAFLPNPDNLPEVNHKDENPKNNHVSNLEWCDHLYNIRYGTGIERHLLPRRKCIEQLTKDGQHVAYHLGVRELCLKTGMNRRSIQYCLYNKPKHRTAYGYIWRFVDVDDSMQFDTEHASALYEPQDYMVEQLTKDGQHVAYFNNRTDAARSVGCTLQNICRAIAKPHQAAKGYRWRLV